MSHPITFCGKDASVTVASNTYSAHNATISLSGRETDVTSFGSSKYGDYKVCIVDGMITLQTYETPVWAPDDVITVVANVAGTNLTYGNCKAISITKEVDAKNIVNFNSTIRITEDPS